MDYNMPRETAEGHSYKRLFDFFNDMIEKLTRPTREFTRREFTAAINFPCSKSWFRIGENNVIFSKIPHGLKL